MDQTLAMETTHFRTYTGLMQPVSHLLHHSTQNTVNFLLSQTCAHQDNWSTKVFWRLVWYFQLSPLAMSDRLLYHTAAWQEVYALAWGIDHSWNPFVFAGQISYILCGSTAPCYHLATATSWLATRLLSYCINSTVHTYTVM